MEHGNSEEFTYDTYLVLFSVNICLIGSYTTFNILQKIRYSRTLCRSIFMLVLSALSLSVLAVWSPHFLMIKSMNFKDLDIFIDLKLTFASMITAIICNTIGFSISFIPFLLRTLKDYDNTINGVKHVALLSVSSVDVSIAKLKLTDRVTTLKPTRVNNVIQKKSHLKLKKRRKVLIKSSVTMTSRNVLVN